jgi:glycine/sarcosine N-methyltransferase
VTRFYDEPADDHHLIYADWDASVRRQGAALDALLGPGRATVLDCACGIGTGTGTQAVGLALHGHRVTGTDLSPRAAARAAREAAHRDVPLSTARCRRPPPTCVNSPFPDDRYRPAATSPQVHRGPDEKKRTVTFQLWHCHWHWHEDGERYDLEHFQLLPADGDWRVRVRRTSYWALGRDRPAGLVTEAGFVASEWRAPSETGFFQPLLVARSVA